MPLLSSLDRLPSYNTLYPENASTYVKRSRSNAQLIKIILLIAIGAIMTFAINEIIVYCFSQRIGQSFRYACLIIECAFIFDAVVYLRSRIFSPFNNVHNNKIWIELNCMCIGGFLIYPICAIIVRWIFVVYSLTSIVTVSWTMKSSMFNEYQEAMRTDQSVYNSLKNNTENDNQSVFDVQRSICTDYYRTLDSKIETNISQTPISCLLRASIQYDALYPSSPNIVYVIASLEISMIYELRYRLTNMLRSYAMWTTNSCIMLLYDKIRPDYKYETLWCLLDGHAKIIQNRFKE